MSRGLDLASTSRNIISNETTVTDSAEMAPFLVSGVATVNDSISTPDNSNSLMIGPLTIPTGKSITVGTGGTLTIV